MDYDRHSSLSFEGGNRKAVTTKTTTVMPYDPHSGVIPPPGTQEEWTTTKRKTNHKTKQVETRVQRQIIMEDGKVIADSGPQVTTKTTEDQKSDETEDTKHRRLGDSEVPEEYRKNIGNQVVFEKNVTHNVMREAKEENLQYHDESLRELDGKEIHRKAKEAPHELIKIDNEIPQIPRGKLVHFSSKGRKINDVDEVQEVSRLDKDGLLNTETTQTHHHEEYEDDEEPEEGQETKNSNEIAHSSRHKQLEYGKPRHEYDEQHSSRTNSSLSLSRNTDRAKGKKWRDPKVDSGDDSDVIETSEVYRLSDRMRSLKTNKNNKSSKIKSHKKDDASTQASLSDSDDETYRHRQGGKHLHEVHERVESRKSTFGTPDKCCDPLEKPKGKYYFGTDSSSALPNDGEKGYVSANVKTKTFAMENNRVLEDKSYNEDFERSFKDKYERQNVQRDYNRFVERTKDQTKGIRDRSMSPMLPPPGPPHEFIHRPMIVEHAPSPLETPARSRSFYDHQVQEYESHKNKKSYHKVDREPYSSSTYRGRSPSPIPVRQPASNTWTKSNDYTTNNSSTSYNHRRPSYSRSNSRSDFPDFAPLSSPLEIKSLTENAMKSRHHISTYN